MDKAEARMNGTQSTSCNSNKMKREVTFPEISPESEDATLEEPETRDHEVV